MFRSSSGNNDPPPPTTTTTTTTTTALPTTTTTTATPTTAQGIINTTSEWESTVYTHIIGSTTIGTDPQLDDKYIVIIAAMSSLLALILLAVFIICFTRNRHNKESRRHADEEIKENEIYDRNGSRKQGSGVPRLDENTVTCSGKESGTINWNPTATDTTYSVVDNSVQSPGGFVEDNAMYENF